LLQTKCRTILALAVVVSTQATGSYAADAGISVQEAVAKIRSAHVVKPQTDFNLAFAGKQAVVQVERPPDESDNDCKIDGVFIAKALVDAYPSAVTDVRVLFFKGSSDAIEIPVSASQLKDYASGKIDKHALLDFIPINKVALAKPPITNFLPNAAHRAFLPQNPEIMARIKAYEAQGIDMSSYRARVDQMKQFHKAKDIDSAKAIRKQLAHDLHLDQ